MSCDNVIFFTQKETTPPNLSPSNGKPPTCSDVSRQFRDQSTYPVCSFPFNPWSEKLFFIHFCNVLNFCWLKRSYINWQNSFHVGPISGHALKFFHHCISLPHCCSLSSRFVSSEISLNRLCMRWALQRTRAGSSVCLDILTAWSLLVGGWSGSVCCCGPSLF